MRNWDDQRFALAIARAGSVKAAARALGVNRSTVVRRLEACEADLGVRLFDRLPQGYAPTGAGVVFLKIAGRAEDLVAEIDRRIAGQDRALSGPIRVSVPAALASYMLMPDIAEFQNAHPQIGLELLTTYGMPDLDRREADVSIRISNDPPGTLIGRRVARVARTVYAGCAHLDGAGTRGPWIGWSAGEPARSWYAESGLPEMPLGPVIADPVVTVRALEAGLGISVLPCMIGDREPGLARVPGARLGWHSDVWVLTHKDMSDTARIRAFVTFMVEVLQRARPALAGQSGPARVAAKSTGGALR